MLARIAGLVALLAVSAQGSAVVRAHSEGNEMSKMQWGGVSESAEPGVHQVVGRTLLENSVTEDTVSCEKEIDEELLGLGIRCGVYMQWVALLLKELGAGGFGESVNHAMIVSVAHVLAVTVQVFRKDYSHETVSIVFWLILGVLFSFTVPALISIAKWRTIILRRTQMALVTLGTMYADAFFLWYWIHGYKEVTDADCGTIYAFFFGKVHMFNWYRYVCIAQVGMHALTTIYTYISLMVLLEPDNGDEWVKDELKRKSESGLVRFLEVKSKIIALFGIISVEMALRYNKLKLSPDTIFETAQLIPLLIGVASLLSVATAMWKHMIKKKEEARPTYMMAYV